MVISNCEITKQDSKILKYEVLDDSSDEFKATKEFHTGVDLSGEKIYSAYDGTVVSVGSDESGQSVIVQTGSSFCVCYKRLISVAVRGGQDISKGTFIGKVEKYVHVEVLKHSENVWPVRIGAQTWYKSSVDSLLENKLSAPNLNKFETLGVTVKPKYDTSKLNNINDGQIRFILSNNK